MFHVGTSKRAKNDQTNITKKHKKRSETISYFIVYMVSLIISLLFLEILVNIAGLDPKIANLLTIGLTTCTNYIGVKKIVFNK